MNRLILTALLLTSAEPAFAAESATLKVIGYLIPRGCDIALPGGNTLDFGLITAAKLQENATSTPFTSQDFTIEVNCAAATKTSVSFIDNRQASRLAGHTDYNFGLGYADSGKTQPIGAAELYLANWPLGEGRVVCPVRSADGQTWTVWSSPSQYKIENNIKLASSTSGSCDRGYSPGAYKKHRLSVSTYVLVNKRSELPAGKSIYLDGSITLELNYY